MALRQLRYLPLKTVWLILKNKTKTIIHVVWKPSILCHILEVWTHALNTNAPCCFSGSGTPASADVLPSMCGYLCTSWPRGCAWVWCRSRRPQRSWGRWCDTRSPSSEGPVAVKSQRCARCRTGYLWDRWFPLLYAFIPLWWECSDQEVALAALPWANLSFFSR